MNDFWNRVDKSDDCWLWMGSRTSSGYGRWWISERRWVRAHRVAYELAKGPIPSGLEIDHLCRVRHCVNPAHLEAVSHKENVLRGEGDYNARKTQCKNGHEFTAENTYVRPTGGRACRTCRRGWKSAHNRRRAKTQR